MPWLTGVKKNVENGVGETVLCRVVCTVQAMLAPERESTESLSKHSLVVARAASSGLSAADALAPRDATCGCARPHFARVPLVCCFSQGGRRPSTCSESLKNSYIANPMPVPIDTLPMLMKTPR